MRMLIAQWWHSRVLKHDQAVVEVYPWGDPPDSGPASIRIRCACGAYWRHDSA